MKKRISDLMDCVEYYPLRVRGDPETSAKRVKEITMRKIGRPAEAGNTAIRRAPRRVLAAAIAAVLIITALSATVLAANAFGIGDYFKSVFGSMSGGQIAVLEEIGRTDMPAVTSGGTTMTPLAAIGDDDFYYLLLKVEAPAGIVLGESDLGRYQITNPDEPESAANISPQWGGQIEVTCIDDTPDDNVINLAIRCMTQYGNKVKFNDGTPKTFRIPGLWLQSPGKAYTKILDGLWEFDIGNFGASGAKELSVNNYNVIGDGGYEITLRSMSVSPLGIRCEYTFARNENVTPGPGVLHAVMKDGTVIEAIQADGSYGTVTAKWHAYFAAPVKVSEIDHIQFGDSTVPVE